MFLNSYANPDINKSSRSVRKTLKRKHFTDEVERTDLSRGKYIRTELTGYVTDEQTGCCKPN